MDWRRVAPIRPVIFEDSGVLSEDTVHLHLEQRVAQRLLARFRAQGFIHHDLSRACLAQTKDSIPRVVLLGRLSLYGRRAERLHEELVPVAARWTEPALRREPLRAYAREAEVRTLALLDESLGSGGPAPNEVVQRRLLDAAPRDIEELKRHLEPRAEESARTAAEALRERGEREAKLLSETLERQRGRVMEEIERHRREFSRSPWTSATTKAGDSSSKPTCATGNGAWLSSTPTSNGSRNASAASTTSSEREWSRWGLCICGRSRIDNESNASLHVKGSRSRSWSARP